jgi:hypothetical protein
LTTGTLMMRGSTSPDSSFASIGLTSGHIVVTARPQQGSSSQSTSFPFPNSTAWLELQKVGSVISAMYSVDGKVWRHAGSSNVGFPSRGYIAGVADISNGSSQGAEMSVDGLTFTPAINQPIPTVSSGAGSGHANVFTASVHGMERLAVNLWRLIRAVASRLA